MTFRPRNSYRLLSLFLSAPLAFPALARSDAQDVVDLQMPQTKTVPSYCGAAISSYDDYLKAKAAQQPLGTMGRDQQPVELTITGSPDPPPAPEDCQGSDPLIAGVEVSTTGSIFGFLNGNGAFRGGGPSPLPPADFAELQRLLDKLPEDGHRLPPEGHSWITVDVLRDGILTLRVYDQTDPPDEIITIIRLTGARIPIFAPSFAHSRQWPSLQQFEATGPPAQIHGYLAVGGHQLALSPDGRLVAAWQTSDYVDCCPRTLTSHFQVSPMNGGDPFLVITDVSHSKPGVGTLDIQATRAAFSPNGRMFLLVTNRPQVRIYDTTTWQLKSDLLPTDAIDYIPSPDWSLGLTVSATGETALWDARKRVVVANLGIEGKFLSASFSPDGKKIATTSQPSDHHPTSLTIWDAADGHRIRQLYPIDWLSSVQGTPVWWGSGRYLLEGFGSPFGSPGIGIWQVSTGRFRAALTTCFNSFAAELLKPDLGGLYQYCYPAGEVWAWDADAIFQQLSTQ
jgi:hypothetical protein